MELDNKIYEPILIYVYKEKREFQIALENEYFETKEKAIDYAIDFLKKQKVRIKQ